MHDPSTCIYLPNNHLLSYLLTYLTHPLPHMESTEHHLDLANHSLYFGQYPKLTLISCSQTQVEQPNTKAWENFLHDLKQAGYDFMHIISLQGSGRVHL